MSRFDPLHKCPAACIHAVGLDASSTRTLLLSLSTIAGAKISNPSWVNFQSAGWGSFQSAPTTLVLKQDDLTLLNRDNERLLGESRQQVKTLHVHEKRIQTLTEEIQGLKLAEAKFAGVTEQLQEQISTLRLDARAFNEAAALSNERELELRLQLVSAQSENEQLRRDKAIEVEPVENGGSTTATPASETPRTKHSRTPRK